MALLGIGLGMVMPVLTLAVQNTVEFRHMGVATSGATLFRSIGGSLGVAAFGALFSHGLQSRVMAALPAGTALPPALGPAAVHQLPDAVRDAYPCVRRFAARRVSGRGDGHRDRVRARVVRRGCAAAQAPLSLPWIATRASSRIAIPIPAITAPARPTRRRTRLQQPVRIGRLFERQPRADLHVHPACQPFERRARSLAISVDVTRDEAEHTRPRQRSTAPVPVRRDRTSAAPIAATCPMLATIRTDGPRRACASARRRRSVDRIIDSRAAAERAGRRDEILLAVVDDRVGAMLANKRGFRGRPDRADHPRAERTRPCVASSPTPPAAACTSTVSPAPT